MADAAHVLMLGHGAMGRAMERLLGPRHEIAVWDRDLETWAETLDLEAAVPAQDFILFALPTNPHGELAARVAAVASPDTICLTIAKGLDDEGRAPHEILHGALAPAQPRGVVYGPMIASDLETGRAGFAMIGTPEREIFDRVSALFDRTALHLEFTDDVTGVSWAVILKNVYVPLIGAADELELGDNVRGFLVCEILRELDEICRGFGGRAGTAYTVAGLGDLVTTATSESSHHRGIGADLAAGRVDRMAGEGVNIRGEGIHALAMIEHHGLLDIDRYPLMALMRSMLDQPEAAAARLRETIEDRGDRRD